MISKLFIVLVSTTLAVGQRGSYAGFRPIGYPDIIPSTLPPGDLGNRFGEAETTTKKLPLEANGDRDLVDRLSKLPLDQQPFWLLNWQALEYQREHPQSYPQRPNSFLDPSSQNNLNAGVAVDNRNVAVSNTDIGNKNVVPNSGSDVSNSNVVANSNTGLGNRNGDPVSNSEVGNRDNNPNSNIEQNNKNNNSNLNINESVNSVLNSNVKPDTSIKDNSNGGLNSNVPTANQNGIPISNLLFLNRNVVQNANNRIVKIKNRVSCLTTNSPVPTQNHDHQTIQYYNDNRPINYPH